MWGDLGTPARVGQRCEDHGMSAPRLFPVCVVWSEMMPVVRCRVQACLSATVTGKAGSRDSASSGRRFARLWALCVEEVNESSPCPGCRQLCYLLSRWLMTGPRFQFNDLCQVSIPQSLFFHVHLWRDSWDLILQPKDLLYELSDFSVWRKRPILFPETTLFLPQTALISLRLFDFHQIASFQEEK